METALYLLAALLLLLLNAFFVLAEFAAVKARPTRMEELAGKGSARAKCMLYIQSHLDEFLSVCQLGITFASIGLGFVGEPGFAKLLMPLFSWAGNLGDAAAHGVAVSCAYILVSFLHIVIGELIPKSLAIRQTEMSALLTARPMSFFRILFFPPLWILNVTVNFCLSLMGIPPAAMREDRSEGEVKLILADSQSAGQMSFHQLLLIENVLDLKGLTARNAMRPKNQVRCLSVGDPPEKNLETIRISKFSRYPILDGAEPPSAYAHIKDIFLGGAAFGQDLKAAARPLMTAREDTPLESLLSSMQRKGCHMAVVTGKDGGWTGMLTLEDAVEEITGLIEEEFPTEPPVSLSDFLKSSRVLIDLPGDSIISTVRGGVKALPPGELSIPLEKAVAAVEQRERLMSSYVGKGLAIPHARMSVTEPFLAVFRPAKPFPSPVPGELVDLLIMIISPENSPRLHQTVLARIAGIMTSEFLESKLSEAKTPPELLEAIRVAELSVLS
jgi:CBS domain containing-hemolysin-like protein/mannitol/fructose-specific phosphotransferase system IIA component (Ntr-type)